MDVVWCYVVNCFAGLFVMFCVLVAMFGCLVFCNVFICCVVGKF